jgi:alpha-glucosidase
MNLYGNHPVYFEHHPYGAGAHVLSLSEMDVKIRSDGESATPLKYNVIGGAFDFYFLTGSETDPAEVARQYAQIAGPTLEHLLRCHFGHLVFINAGTGIKVCFLSRVQRL